MKVTATLSRYRISPRKARLVVKEVVGLGVAPAAETLEHLPKKAAHQLKKLLMSAVSNAEHNFGLDKENLYVYDIQVGDGLTMKRWMPRAHGRASQILKRTSNITLTLNEREEGKNRKSAEDLEKEREEKRKKEAKEFSEKAKKEKEMNEDGTEKSAKEVKDAASAPKSSSAPESIAKEKKSGADSGWKQQVFRRKAGK